MPDVSPFALGGANSVRGYPASEVRGARGVFATSTLRYSSALGPLRTAARMFVDAGKVFDTVGAADDKVSLASAGVGIDLGMPASVFQLSAKVDVSFPFTGPRPASDGKNGSRLFASVAGTF